MAETNYPHLSKAPITEAVIDFRVQARPDFNAQDLDPLKGELTKEFPTVLAHHLHEASFSLQGSGGASVQAKAPAFNGLIFQTKDEKNILQCRIDGLTYSRLNPYTSWDDIFPKAVKYWKRYVKHVSPKAVTRVAVRYINRIEIHPELKQLNELLLTCPTVPQGLRLAVGGFLNRIAVEDQDTGLKAFITQVVEPQLGAGLPALILDIDAFREGDWKADEPVVEQTFHELRIFKNAIFFNSLTKELIARYE